MFILIAGAAGALGSHMCDLLLAKGHTVVGIDNLSSGRIENLKDAALNPNFRFNEADIKFFDFNSKYKSKNFKFEDYKFNQIYNFACVASPKLYQIDPIDTMLTCVLGTKNLLDLATSHSATFFQASTSEIYGNPEIHPQVETYNGNVKTTSPRSCYDEGKRAAETLCFDYYRKYNTKIKVARIFNTFSPRNHSNDGRVMPNFIKQALNNEDLTIFGDGTQTRSICYWKDAIVGYEKLMFGTDANFTGPINIGSENEISILNLAKSIIKITNSKSRIVFQHQLPEDDPIRRRADISMAKSILNWEPKFSLKDAIKEMIASKE